MTELVGKGVFSVLKSNPSGNSVLLVGKLDSGGLAIGWKARMNGKVAEVTDIGLSSIHPETVVITLEGITIGDIAQTKSLEFATVLL